MGLRLSDLWFIDLMIRIYLFRGEDCMDVGFKYLGFSDSGFMELWGECVRDVGFRDLRVRVLVIQGLAMSCLWIYGLGNSNLET